MAKVTEDQVMAKLSTVMDPEINLDIVSLGLIYNVEISEDDEVHVIMTLTTPGCPMAGMLAQGAESALLNMNGVKDVLIEVVFEPPWNPSMMSDEAKKQLGLE